MKLTPFLKTFNTRQREAVLYEDGGVLVLAGAGTGKTRVLTGRIIHLLGSGQAQPQDILAVTFTNKAAAEMKQRIHTALQHAPHHLMLGTFHGICHRMLRAHAEAAGLDKNFQILDSSDQLAFLRRLMREHEVNELRFPAQEIRNYITAIKERGIRAADARPHGEHQRQMAKIYQWYEDACRAENRVDFAELMLAVVELLRARTDLRKHYAQRFRYILVDELQDTNRLQFEWLQLLDSGKNHYFGVGDDDQSIYGFRGAEPAIMQEFQAHLRAKKLIRLEKNYRSVKCILDVANKLISSNRHRLGKTLSAAAGKGDLVEVIPSDTDEMEAKMVSQLLLAHIREGGSAGETAVLYRTNAQGRLFERELMQHGLPYRIYGGVRFYERMEIRQALAYLRLIAEDDADALRRAINTPPRGIGEKTLSNLAASGDLFAGIQASAQKSVVAFRAVLAALRTPQPDLAAIVRNMLEASGLLAHYEHKRKDADRSANLRELVNAATQFEAGYKQGDADTSTDILNGFLASVALQESGEGKESAAQKTVSLMTVHAAKGLEFMRVFIVGMEEGLFPHAQSIQSEREIEEERRLLYVAITRARRQLSLHFSRSRMLYGDRSDAKPSRFLKELPKESLVDNGWNKRPEERTGAASDNERMLATLPPPPRIRSEYEEGFRKGDAVRHGKYGTGVIMKHSNEQMEIYFKGAGRKVFKTALVKLEKI